MFLTSALGSFRTYLALQYADIASLVYEYRALKAACFLAHLTASMYDFLLCLFLGSGLAWYWAIDLARPGPIVPKILLNIPFRIS